jgi:hypothetical protein
MFLKKVRIIINGKDVKGSDLGLFQLFWYFLEQTGPIEGLKIQKALAGSPGVFM